MLKVKNSGQFRKDYKKCSRRGFNMNLLKSVVAILAVPAALPQKTLMDLPPISKNENVQ